LRIEPQVFGQIVVRQLGNAVSERRYGPATRQSVPESLSAVARDSFLELFAGIIGFRIACPQPLHGVRSVSTLTVCPRVDRNSPVGVAAGAAVVAVAPFHVWRDVKQ
jgi:hypothetical protein